MAAESIRHGGITQVRTRTDMALPGLAGALVVAAVLVCAWVARDSSAGTDPEAHAHENLPVRSYFSARSHRSPVTRTSIPPQRQPVHEPRAAPGDATR